MLSLKIFPINVYNFMNFFKVPPQKSQTSVTVLSVYCNCLALAKESEKQHFWDKNMLFTIALNNNHKEYITSQDKDHQRDRVYERLLDDIVCSLHHKE